MMRNVKKLIQIPVATVIVLIAIFVWVLIGIAGWVADAS